jgi:hypothetical protein
VIVLRTVSKRAGERIGLKELRARTEPGECPFCGDSIPDNAKGRKLKYCGDSICRSAYFRYYNADRRAAQVLLGRTVFGTQRVRRSQTYVREVDLDAE